MHCKTRLPFSLQTLVGIEHFYVLLDEIFVFGGDVESATGTDAVTGTRVAVDDPVEGTAVLNGKGASLGPEFLTPPLGRPFGHCVVMLIAGSRGIRFKV